MRRQSVVTLGDIKANIQPCSSSKVLDLKAATLIAARVIENPYMSIGVAVGAQPSGVYRCLVELYHQKVIDLKNCHFFLLDEFFPESPPPKQGLPSTRRGPHFKELCDYFFADAEIPDSHLHSPNCSLSPKQAAEAYAEELRIKPLDLVIFGVGPEGKVGWVSSLDSDTKGVGVVDISSKTVQENGGYAYCVTLGYKLLLQSKELIQIVIGKNKAETIYNIITTAGFKSTTGNLLNNHNHMTLFLDSESAALLSEVAKPPPKIAGFRIWNESNCPTGMRIVCFSPHPDDTSISAGATLSLLSEKNKVTSVIATTGHHAFIPDTTRAERIAIREKEASEEATVLGAHSHFLRLPLYDHANHITESDTSIVYEYLKDENPHMIFMPHTGDSHQTHRAVVKVVLLAIQQLLNQEDDIALQELFMYEGPWSLFSSGCYNTISSPPADTFAKKVSAIRAHTSQTARTAYDTAAFALAQLRGSLVPEQDLSGYGAEPPKLEEKVELFHCIAVTKRGPGSAVSTPNSSPTLTRRKGPVDELLTLVDESKPPLVKNF